jgi:hypothetical protein
MIGQVSRAGEEKKENNSRSHPHMAVLEVGWPHDQNPLAALAMGAFSPYKRHYERALLARQ